MGNASTYIQEHSAAGPSEVQGPARRQFDSVTVMAHWITLLLVLVLVATGLMHGQLEDRPWAPSLLWAHRSLGVIIWTITIARLTWRLTGAKFPEFPSSMTRLHRLGARLSEYGLYALLLIQPLSGLEQTISRGKPFELLLWTVPALVPQDLGHVVLFYALHKLGAWCFIGLVSLHAAAALFHHFVRRDDVLEAMAPFLRRRRVPDPVAVENTNSNTTGTVPDTAR
jgi:superoxide oxidase